MYPVFLTSLLTAPFAMPLALAASAAALLAASASTRPEQAAAGDQRVEMEVLGVVPIEEDGTSLLVLEDKRTETILPLVIGQPEAMAIALRLNGENPPRPLTFDLLDHAIAALGGRVTDVEIGTVRESVFQARIQVKQGEKRLVIDARPSDSIALALRCRAPIYAQRQVLEDAGLSKSDLDRLRKEQPDDRSGSPEASL